MAREAKGAAAAIQPEGRRMSNSDEKAFLNRIESLMKEKDQLSEDIRSIYAEAKAADMDVKRLRVLVRVRRMDSAARWLLEEALGAFSDTPLGSAAINRLNQHPGA